MVQRSENVFVVVKPPADGFVVARLRENSRVQITVVRAFDESPDVVISIFPPESVRGLLRCSSFRGAHRFFFSAAPDATSAAPAGTAGAAGAGTDGGGGDGFGVDDDGGAGAGSEAGASASALSDPLLLHCSVQYYTG